jgi:PAS domain S-box-containing protein
MKQTVDAGAVLQSEARYRLLIEQFTLYAFIITTPEGIITAWDGGAEKLLQYTADEAIGKPITIIFTDHDISHGEDKKEREQALKHGFAEDERWHVRKDENIFWGSGIIVPLRSRGKVIGFGKIFRDRTNHTAIERRKDDFVGIAGHELRNPLSILKSNIELIMLNPTVAADKELSSIHKNLNEQVDRLSNLVNDLLDLSKIASGQLHPNKKRVNMKDLVESVANNYQSIVRNHSLRLVEGHEVEVMADENQIIQVLNNLISNAVKYSPNGNDIELSVFDMPKHARVSVKDHGIGISDAEKNKIFDRFYRVDHKHQTAMGLGIGLYVCLEIVKAHNGTIGVESNKGPGSTFYFTLPK